MRAFQTLILIQPPEEIGSRGAMGNWQESSQESNNTYALVIEIKLGTNIATASFDSRAIEPWIVRKLLERLDFVMSQLAIAKPKQTLAYIEMCTPQDMKKIWQWNQDVPISDARCIHDVIHQQAKLQPELVALDAWDGKLTYKELIKLAIGLSEQLVQYGEHYDELVPLCFEKSIWAVVAMVGVLKAGRGFVMLDPCLPEQRLRTILDQVGSRLLLSSTANVTLSKKIARQIVEIGPNLFHQRRSRSPAGASSLQLPSDIMYGVFTSGSTGSPKGVLISHTNFCSAMRYQLPLLGFRSGCRVLDFASYAFDVAIHDTMATLACYWWMSVHPC
ncbi:male sterility, NAD-binding protein [Fusarium bulbicola]|nr:male sterility, NAD-binding protein [Fusarium bulbicola]